MEQLLLMLVGSMLTSGMQRYMLDLQQEKEFGQQDKLLDKEQQFQAEREDINWQRQRPQQIYQDYLDLGFNPNLAAQSVLGGNAETASAGSSPSAPSVNSAISAMQSALGQHSDQLYNLFAKNAEIQNMQANTHKTDIEAGIMPRDYEIRKWSAEAQIRYWDKSVDKIAKEMKFTEEQTNLVRQQNLFYGRETEAKIQSYLQQVTESIKKCELMDSEIRKNAATTENIGANTEVQRATTENIHQDTILKSNQSNHELYMAERERIAKEFEESVNGIPLTADAQKYVHKLLLDGKYNEVQQFYMGVFQSSLNQTMGVQMGTPRAKLGLPYGGYLLGYPRQSSSISYDYMYGNGVPYWNPPK